MTGSDDVEAERPLRAVLQDAQPSWTERSVSVAESKLLQIGIETSDALAEALKGNLNDRLREEGLKTFSTETLKGLRATLRVKLRASGDRSPWAPLAQGSFSRRAQSALTSQSTAGQAGEDLYQEFFALVDTPSSAAPAPARTQPQPQRPAVSTGTAEPIEEVPDDTDPDVARSLKHFRDCSIDELQKECRRRDLPGGDRSKDQLLSLLQEDLEWQLMGKSQLRRLCANRGMSLPEQGQTNERPMLLSLLADERWALAGIPIKRLNRRENAHGLLLEIQRLNRQQIGQLVAESRSLKMPAKPTLGKKKLVEQLKLDLIWRQLSPPELVEECKQRGGMVAKPVQREQILQELLRSTWIEEWEALGIPVRRFGDLKVAEEVVAEFTQIKDKQDVHLKARCAELGVPLDRYVPRQEVLRRLRSYIIWQRMPLSELEKDCILLDLPSAANSPSGRAREQLSDRLMNHACMTTWKVLEIPAEHLTLKAASHVADVFEYLDAASEAELREKYQDTFLDEQMNRSEVVERLKMVVIWQELPCSVLRDECSKKAMKLDDIGKAGAEDDDSEETRDILMGKLLLHERAKRWKDDGVPLDRLHNAEAAAELMLRWRELDEMSDAGILAQYKHLGLPEEEDMVRSAMLTVLKTKALWYALSWPELLKECQRRDISVERFTEDGVDEDEEELWTKHSGALIKQLLEFEVMQMWEVRGFPIQRLRNFDAAVLLVERYEQVAQSSTEDLRQECATLNLPTPPNMDRSVLARRLRIRSLWRSLSMAELLRECELRDLSIGDLFDIGDGGPRSELWQRQQMVRRLGSYECMVAWEEEGFQALRIGNVEAVFSLAERYGSLRAMSNSDLRAAYLERGLPEEELMERQVMLENFKQVLEWEAMPVEELRKDCQERGMPAAVWAGGDHWALLARLLMDLYEPVYVRKGVPVKALTSLKAASALARRFEELKVMEPMKLQSECASLGMPSRARTPSILRERLRKAYLWEQLGIEQLQVEAALMGVKAKAEAMGNATQVRDLLMLQLCLEDFGAVGVPVHRLRSLQAAVALEQKMRQVQELSEFQLKQECLARRVPTSSRAVRWELLELVSRLNLWEELPPEELRAECQDAGIPHQQMVPLSYSQDDQRRFLRELLLTGACQPALAERGISPEEVNSVSACFTVVEAWDKLGAMTEADLKLEYKGAGLSPMGVPAAKMLERLRQMRLWMEAPLPNIQKECRKVGINSIARENEKADLIKNLVRAKWAEPSPEQQQRQREQREQKEREEQQRRQGRQQQQEQQGRGAAPPPSSGAASRQQLAAHLRTLGLSLPLNLEDVKRSYKKLVLKYHPDKNPDGDKEKVAEVFRNIQEAYKFIRHHAEAGGPTKFADDPGDAVLAGSFSLVGSWNDWKDFLELRADSSGNYFADVDIPSGADVEFQVLCDGNWDRRLYPNPSGDLVLGPASEEAHGMNWRLPPQKSNATLRVKLRPRARRLEFFAVH